MNINYYLLYLFLVTVFSSTDVNIIKSVAIITFIRNLHKCITKSNHREISSINRFSTIIK